MDLKKEEQFVVAELQGKYEQLSPEAQKAVALGVSWAERNIWPWTIMVAAAFWAIGHYIQF